MSEVRRLVRISFTLLHIHWTYCPVYQWIYEETLFYYTVDDELKIQVLPMGWLLAAVEQSRAYLVQIRLLQIYIWEVKQTYSIIHTRDLNWKMHEGLRLSSELIHKLFIFCFYINKVIEFISQMNMGCSSNGFRCNIFGYEDDLVLLASLSGALQVLLNKLHSLLNLLWTKNKCW